MMRFAAAVFMIAATASALRLAHLDERPMHADEAILADKFGELLGGGGYPYDPREFHGPVLAYFSLASAALAGRMSYGALTETTLRLVPAVFGILLALSPLLLTRAIGRHAALAAAALLAVAPPMAYYSRFYIPETLLAFWTAVLLAALWVALERPGRLPWAAAGAAAGLMLATKETAVLALAACAAALVLASWGKRRPAPLWKGPSLRSKAAVFTGAMLAVTALLLASPWKWPALAAAPAYLSRAVHPGGHAHAWTYYLALAWWALPPAAVGLAMALCSNRPFLRFLGYYAVLVSAMYCAIPYKTPWCVLTMLYGFSLLAGIAADALARRWRAPVAIAFLAGLTLLAWHAWTLSTNMAADSRNPLAYSQTGAGVFTIRDRVRQIARAAPEGAATAIAVYSRQNLWPLPWYLRDYPNVLWWREVAVPGRAAPIVLLSPEMEPALAHKIYDGPPPGQRELYVSMFDAGVELRPQVEIRGYVAKSLWDRWQQTR